MPAMTTCLWFDDKGEEAATFYVSIFPNSAVTGITRFGPDEPGPEGAVMTVDFELDGQRFVALNGGPQFTFSEAVSVQVHVDTQEEVDHYWNVLVDGGEESVCGWLKDRYGFSWQIVPNVLLEHMTGSDRAKASRVTQAMLSMKKLDVAALEQAAAAR
jgi:predicted 3-demethylubiquinone-9 3-methyltransferase (glyoxalase superfamily)